MFFPLEKRKSLMLYCMNNPPASLTGSKLLEVKTFDGVKYVAEDGSHKFKFTADSFKDSNTETVTKKVKKKIISCNSLFPLQRST